MATDINKVVTKISKEVAGKAPVGISTGGMSPDVWRDTQKVQQSIRREAFSQGQMQRAQEGPWDMAVANSPGGLGPNGQKLPYGAKGWGQHGEPVYDLLSPKGFWAKVTANWHDDTTPEELEKYPSIPFSLDDFIKRRDDPRVKAFNANPEDPAAAKAFVEWRTENGQMVAQELGWGLGWWGNEWKKAGQTTSPAIPMQVLKGATRTAASAVNLLGATFEMVPQAYEMQIGPDIIAADQLVSEKYKERGWDPEGNNWIKYFRKEADWGMATSLAKIGGQLATMVLLNVEHWKGEISREDFEERRDLIERTQAARIAYTAVAYPERVRDFEARAEQGEDPTLLAAELEDTNAEIMGRLIFDPVNVLSIPLSKFNAVRKANKAAAIYAQIADPEVLRILQSGTGAADDLARASDRIGQMYRSAEAGIAEEAIKRGPFIRTAGGKVDYYGKRTANLMGVLFDHANSDPDTYFDILQGMARASSADDAVRLEGLLQLSKYKMPPGVLFSPAGNETAIFLRDLMTDAEGQITGKKILSLVSGHRDNPAGLLQALSDLNAEQLAKKFPTVGKRIEHAEAYKALLAAGDESGAAAFLAKNPLADTEVPRFLRAIEPTHEALQKYIYRPWAAIQGTAYMSTNPAYWMRNRWSNAVHVFVDEGPLPALKAFFRYGPENNAAYLQKTLGFIPKSAAEGIGVMGSAEGAKGFLFSKQAALDEQAAAAEIVATSVRRTMRGAFQEGRAIPRAAEMLSEFSPAEQKILVDLARKTSGNAKETIKIFRNIGRTEGWSTARELSFLNAQQLDKLEELRLLDPALDAVRVAENYDDAIRRLDEVLGQYRTVGRAAAGEVPALDVTDPFQAALADVAHGLNENLGEEAGDIFARQNLMRERSSQAWIDAADEVEELAQRKVVHDATAEAARQGVASPANDAADAVIDRFRILRRETADRVTARRQQVINASHEFMDGRHAISGNMHKWKTEQLKAYWRSHGFGVPDEAWSRSELLRETKNRFWRAARDKQQRVFLALHKYTIRQSAARSEAMALVAGVDLNRHGLTLEARAQQARATMFEGIYLERGAAYVDVPIDRLGEAVALRMAKDAGLDPEAAKALLAELKAMEPGEAELFLRQHPEIERAIGEVTGFPGSNEADILKRLEARDALVGSGAAERQALNDEYANLNERLWNAATPKEEIPDIKARMAEIDNILRPVAAAPAAAETEADLIARRLQEATQRPQGILEREGAAALDQQRMETAREAYRQRTARAAWRETGERTFRMEAVAPADIAAPTPARFHYQTQGAARQAIDELKNGLQEHWDDLEQVSMTAPKERQLKAWAEELRARATTAKAIAVGVANAARDFTLHNYKDRKGIDLMLGYIYPYQFWHSRTYLKWMQRMFTNPAIVSGYFKYRGAMEKLHADLPPWWRTNINLSELLGIQTDNPMYFNLEATLNPVNGLTGIDFNDRYKRLDWWSATADDMNKFGPTMWTPYQMAIALYYHSQGKEDAAARWTGRAWGPTKTIRDMTALLGMNAGKGVELDPFVNYFSGGLDPYERSRVGRMLTSMEGEYTQAELQDAARNQSGPIWDEAVKRAIHLRAPDLWTIAAPFFLGSGFKPRTEQDVEIDRFYNEQFGLIQRRADMTPEAYRKAWQDLEAKYPFMDTLTISRRPGLERDEAYAWSVLDRLPPGRANALIERVGGKYEMIEAFYENKGDLAAMSESERGHFMSVVLDLAALLEVPPAATKAEWDEASSLYGAMSVRMGAVFGEDINDLIDQYYARLGDDKQSRDAANAFLDAHPIIGQALDWKQQQVTSDPLLSAYYNSLEKTTRYLKTQMYAEAEKTFGKDLWDKWDVYDRLKKADPKAAKAYFKDHPELKDYLDFRDERLGAIDAEAQRIAQWIPEGRPEIYRQPQETLPLSGTSTSEEWIQGQVQEYLPEPTESYQPAANLPLAIPWETWSNMVGAPTARLLADHYRDGTPLSEAVLKRMEVFAGPMGTTPEALVGMIGASYGQ